MSEEQVREMDKQTQIASVYLNDPSEAAVAAEEPVMLVLGLGLKAKIFGLGLGLGLGMQYLGLVLKTLALLCAR